MTPERTESYAALYAEGRAALTQADVPEAALDARLLLEHVCGTDHHTLLAHGNRPVSAAECGAYEALLKERCARVPLAYLTGHQEFMGLDFTVGRSVLIPNQDTETLAEEALRHLFDGMRFLEIGAGSGCVALSLLSYTNGTTAVMTDLSQEALAEAKRNAERLGLQERAAPVRADLFPQEAERFDLIVSNPPYIASGVIETLAPEVRLYEPRLALDGGADGLACIRRIAEASPQWLFSGGMLFLEHGYDQGEAVAALLRENGFQDVKTVRDLGGRDRVTYGCLYDRKGR